MRAPSPKGRPKPHGVQRGRRPAHTDGTPVASDGTFDVFARRKARRKVIREAR